MSRLRGGSKAPLAVAGILALPLFFLALLAFSLELDKPSQRVNAKGVVVLGDPTKGTIGSVYAVALAVSLGLVVVGVLAMLLRSRLAVAVPAGAVIVAAILLVVPLGSWAAQHTARYPLGVDNIPQRSPQDIFLRGEWEQNARTAARQIGFTTMGMAALAILLTGALEIRRRRGRPDLLLQPSGIDAEMGSGGAPQITGG